MGELESVALNAESQSPLSVWVFVKQIHGFAALLKISYSIDSEIRWCVPSAFPEYTRAASERTGWLANRRRKSFHSIIFGSGML